MPHPARDIVTDATRDLLRSWRTLTLVDLAFKAIAFGVLMPGITGLLYWLRSDTSSRVMADADILRFFLTTPTGVVTLVLGGALIFAVTALESACLMAIGLAASNGTVPTARSVLVFAAARAPGVLRLTLHMVLRLLAGFLPFALGAGVVYLALLRDFDINFYLTQRPPAFWIAAACIGALAAAMVALLVRAIARWALALPLLLFEGVHPRRALGESARRSSGSRQRILLVLAAWAVVAAALATAARWLPEFLGRVAATYVAGSLPALLLFIAALALVWGAFVLAAGIVNVSLFALVLLRTWMHVGASRGATVPELAAADAAPRLSGRARAGAIVAGALVAFGIALLAFFVTRGERPVLVIAHRGASAAAPENTLAAFRLAVEQGADFVELDVQESADGEVVVAHDSDLMKLAGFPGKIWETDAATLRSIDIGSSRDPKFSAERVPTLAEALAVCKGRSRVLVELKSYGHDQKLEERVVAIVEAAGMQDHCRFMSLDHAMVRKMKQLRPSWRSGLLVAKAYGDLTSLGADFLAVEARMASARFVRRAHRAGQDVYVWTVNDPAAMLTGLSRGVDGLITDKPDLARQVVERRSRMSDGQRLLVALLIRVGARTEALESIDALRP